MMKNQDNLKLKQAFGPLWNIFNNPEVNEIIVDHFDDVYYVERNKIKDNVKLFKSEKEVLNVINKLTKLSGKKIESHVYHYDLNLSDNVRIHVVLPPVSLNGPTLNLIKIPKQRLILDDLHKWEALDDKSLKILKSKIHSHTSMLVAGPMGSGKTTLLNCILNEIPKEERVVTIETTASLVLNRKRCVRLVPENNQVSETKELIGASLKMRADRIALAYMSGPESIDFINAIREGHTGYAGFTAENIFDVIRRLEIMMMGQDLGMSLDNVRYSIAQAFKLIVFQERLENGKRKLTNIAEVKYDSGEIKLELLYKS
jgi:pilus assembly protein CpaF